ncbi:hypothetical protein Tco_0425802 [Tanacetum coccineum]
MKIKESLNMIFDETPPPSKTSPLVDDDLDEEEAIKVTENKNLENDIEDETLKTNEVVNIKESMNHPLENVIGNLGQRTLRSQAQNQSNFFCFISTIEPKKVNEALKDVIFELKKILLDKMEESKLYQTASAHRELYNRLINSYNLDKDLFSSYGKAYSLKRDRKDKDKDEDPPAGSDQGLKKRKTSKDAEPSKGSKSKESRSSSSSKGIKPQPKSSGKSTQAEEPLFEAADTKSATESRI